MPFPEDLDLSSMPGVDSGEDAFTRIYLAMLRQPASTRASLVAEGIAGSVIDEVVPVMAARGL